MARVDLVAFLNFFCYGAFSTVFTGGAGEVILAGFGDELNGYSSSPSHSFDKVFRDIWHYFVVLWV